METLPPSRGREGGGGWMQNVCVPILSGVYKGGVGGGREGGKEGWIEERSDERRGKGA